MISMVPILFGITGVGLKFHGKLHVIFSRLPVSLICYVDTYLNYAAGEGSKPSI